MDRAQVVSTWFSACVCVSVSLSLSLPLSGLARSLSLPLSRSRALHFCLSRSLFVPLCLSFSRSLSLSLSVSLSLSLCLCLCLSPCIRVDFRSSRCHDDSHAEMRMDHSDTYTKAQYLPWQCFHYCLNSVLVNLLAHVSLQR